MAVRTDVPDAGHSDSAFAGLIRPSLLSMIPHVTDDEIMHAFASTTVCVDDSPASLTASLRCLSIQNNVLFRMIVHGRHFAKISGMLTCRCYLLLCGCHASLRCVFDIRCDFELFCVFVVVCWIVSELYSR